MGSARSLTKEEAAKIWLLHKKGLKSSEICGVMDRDSATVSRIIRLFKATEAGQFAEIENSFGDNYKRLQQIAKEHFGITDEPKKEVEPQKTPTPHKDETIHYLTAVLSELQKMSNLLTLLCEECGVRHA